MKESSELSEISERVKRLTAQLGSVVVIEALLALARMPERAFSAAELGKELHVTTDLEPVLERLGSLNLLDIRVRSKLSYRYAPTSTELDATVRELAGEYALRRLAVLEHVTSKSPITAFADAFRFRKRKDPDG